MKLLLIIGVRGLKSSEDMLGEIGDVDEMCMCLHVLMLSHHGIMEIAFRRSAETKFEMDLLWKACSVTGRREVDLLCFTWCALCALCSSFLLV